MLVSLLLCVCCVGWRMRVWLNWRWLRRIVVCGVLCLVVRGVVLCSVLRFRFGWLLRWWWFRFVWVLRVICWFSLLCWKLCWLRCCCCKGWCDECV